MTMKTESYKIYGMQQKQLLEESSTIIQAFPKKWEKSEINNLTYNLKNKKREQTKSKKSA